VTDRGVTDPNTPHGTDGIRPVPMASFGGLWGPAGGPGVRAMMIDDADMRERRVLTYDAQSTRGHR